MAKSMVRNISGESRHVAELDWRLVEPDEVIKVPKSRLEAFISQDGIWADEGEE